MSLFWLKLGSGYCLISHALDLLAGPQAAFCFIHGSNCWEYLPNLAQVPPTKRVTELQPDYALPDSGGVEPSAHLWSCLFYILCVCVCDTGPQCALYIL